LRFWDNTKLTEYLNEAYAAKLKYPNLIIGFDLVAEETTRKACDFAEVFKYHKENIQSVQPENLQLPFIFHGGESLYLENDNMIDLLEL